VYESLYDPVISRLAFFARMAIHLLFSFGLLFGSLGVGVIGYHHFEKLPWIDSLLNASMILGGMGPVDTMHTRSGKLFASIYALYSGVVFLFTCGILFAPLLHRLLHQLHTDDDDVKDDKP
jgi:hypothetical protein